MVVDVLIIVFFFSQFCEDEFNKYHNILKITLDHVCAAAVVSQPHKVLFSPGTTASKLYSSNRLCEARGKEETESDDVEEGEK